jgi:predicted nucleic acid-binding protein
MIYPDTSVLVSLILNEPRADFVTDKLRQLNRPLCLSEWTVHELHCALARAVFLDRISEHDFARVLGEALDFISSIKLGCPLLGIAAYQLSNIDAMIMIKPKLGLRAADAYHLGILLGLPDITLLTADRLLHTAATMLEIDSILIS